MSCGVGCRHGSDPTLLWFWCRLAAVAPIRPLAWESPYAAEAALEKAKRQKIIIIIIKKLKKRMYFHKSLLSNTKKNKDRSSHRGATETNPMRNHEVAGLISGLAQWLKELWHCHELWCRLQMRLRSLVAVALV